MSNMDEEDITTNEQEDKSVDPELIDKWSKQIMEGYNVIAKEFVSLEPIPDKVANAIFSDIQPDAKIEGRYRVKFQDTYFYFNWFEDQNVFNLVLDVDANACPKWLSPDVINMANSQIKQGKTSPREKYKKLKEERENQAKNQDVKHDVKKEPRKEKRVRGNKTITKIKTKRKGLIYNKKEANTNERRIENIEIKESSSYKLDESWKDSNLSKNAQKLVPPSGAKTLDDKWLSSLSNEDLFGLSKRWHDWFEKGYWEHTSIYEEIRKKDNKDLIQKEQLISWFKSINYEIWHMRNIVKTVFHFINVIAERLEGIACRDRDVVKMKKDEINRLSSLEEKSNVMAKQLGTGSLVGEGKKVEVKRAFKFKPKVDYVRQKLAEKNIKKYKDNGSWINDSEWKKMTLFQRIMKRWKFTDVHQCLTPWDEAKLSREDLRTFHIQKKEWRAKRKQEILDKEGNYNSWVMRRFDKNAHARIIRDRMWTGLDMLYEEDIGASKLAYKTSWKTINNKRRWHKWQSRYSMARNSNNNNNNNAERFQNHSNDNNGMLEENSN